MKAARREYSQLVRAMEHTEPACADDTRFTLDAHQVHEQEATELRHICRGCPLRVECDEYGRAAKPPSGMWAGRFYPQRSIPMDERIWT